MADWKTNLSFSDRLTETAKMQVSILSGCNEGTIC